jgi:predicted aspartyl protease
MTSSHGHLLFSIALADALPMRRPRAIILVVLLASVGAVATGPVRGQAPQVTLPPIPAASVATAMPLYAVPTTHDRSGRIAVPVLINGQGPFRFLLDTGANRSAITSDLASRLGLDVSTESDIMVNGVNGRVAARRALVPSMKLGEIEVGPQHLPVLDGQVYTDLDGSLGADLLGDLCVTVDFVRDRVTITRLADARNNPYQGVIQAKRLSGWLLQAEGLARGARMQMIVDTGAAQTLGNRALYRALTGRQIDDAPALRVDVLDATQTSGRASAISVSPIVLGDVIINNSYVVFGDFTVFALWNMERKPALLLGMDVLGSLRELVIDYRLKQLQVVPRFQ